MRHAGRRGREPPLLSSLCAYFAGRWLEAFETLLELLRR